MRPFLPVVLVFLALLPSLEAHGAGLAFAAAGLERCRSRVGELAEGEVMYIEQVPAEGTGVALTACAVLDEPLAAVWPVLRDCEHYRLFLPGVARSALRHRSGNVALCEASIDLPFPLGDLDSVERATETTLPEGGFERRWTLDSGSYSRLEGSWTVLPWNGDADRSLLVYQLDMDPETVLPDFALRRAQSATAPEVFVAIRRRVRECGASQTGCVGE